MKPPLDGLVSAERLGPLAATATFAAGLGGNTVRNLRQWCGALMRRPRAKTPPLSVRAIAAIIVVSLAIVPTMFFVDARATDWASHRPAWFSGMFEQITDFGLSGWFLIPSGCIVLGLASLASPALSRMSRGVLAVLAARFGFVFLAIGAPGLFTSIIKRLIGRARPFVGGSDNPFAYMFFVWRPEYAAMPSGHATNVAAAAIAIGAIWPRLRAVMWLYALVIMFSRIIVFAHHASDVIAGALVGALGAALIRRFFAARRLVFSARDLSACPGPSLARTYRALRDAVSVPWRSRNAQSAAD
jgi:membrane-associated phospholipid phosphatase